MSSLVSLVTAAITLISTFLVSIFGYGVDIADTTKAYRERVAGLTFYENTIETALPQTIVYDMVAEHFDSPLPDGKTEKKAIIIGFDGGRADALDAFSVENGGSKMLLESGGKAYIAYAGGANFPLPIIQATSTAPGWCSILTGKWGLETGIINNGITKAVEPKTLLTTLVEDGKADQTMFQVSWGGHFTSDNSTYKLEKAYCEENSLNVVFGKNPDDPGTHASMLAAVTEPDCPDFIMGIYEHMDAAGHGTGYTVNNPDYQQAYIDSETCAGELIAAIESRPTYEQEDWLIVITSDHGGKWSGHGTLYIQERMIFIVTNKEITQ